MTEESPPRLVRVARDSAAKVLTVEEFGADGWNETPDALSALRASAVYEVGEDEADVIGSAITAAVGAAPDSRPRTPQQGQ